MMSKVEPLSVSGAGHVAAKKGRLIKVGYNHYSATSSSKVPPISEEHHKLETELS